MSRLPRWLVPGGIHHVTVRGNDRQAIFKDDADRKAYIRELSDGCEAWRCDLVAYALMTNHVHLVLQDHRSQLSRLMQILNARYTRYFNRRHQRVGHLYQGRFHSRHIDRDEYLLEVTRYVHLNPVRAGITKNPEDHPWSSYRVYAGLEEPGTHNVYPDAVWLLMSHDPARQPALCRQFVLTMTPEQFPAWERRLQRLRLVSDTVLAS